jgi:hypothetical protein
MTTKAPTNPADIVKPAAEGATTPTSETTLPVTGDAGATASAAGAVTLAAEQTARDNSSIDPDGRYTVVVQGPAAGRWRIGRHFTAEPTSIPARDLTEAQVTALRDDPALMVSVIAAPD